MNKFEKLTIVLLILLSWVLSILFALYKQKEYLLDNLEIKYYVDCKYGNEMLNLKSTAKINIEEPLMLECPDVRYQWWPLFN